MAIFTGRVGGPHILTLPWVRKPAELQDVHSSDIAISPGKGIRIGTRATVVVGSAVDTSETVSCIVPGHEQPGTEHHTDLLASDDPPFVWELTGTCAFSAPFTYAGE